MANIDVWKVCEVSPQLGVLLTLRCPYKGSRHLPFRRWLKAETFQRRYDRRTYCGFCVYPDLTDAEAFLKRYNLSKTIALVGCNAIGLIDSQTEDGVFYADQIKLIETQRVRVAA